MKFTQLTDEEVIATLCNTSKRTEQDALISELYYRYNERIVSWLVLKTHDVDKAQELTSQVIEKLVKALRKHAGTKAEKPIQHFKSWLYRIAHNAFIDDLQKQKREKTQIFGEDSVGKPQEDSLIDESRELLEVKLDFEYRHTLQELAIFLLSDSQREVYLARYYRSVGEEKRMQVKQVAESLQMTTRMVWTNLKTGKEKLEKLITEAYKRNVSINEVIPVFEKVLDKIPLEKKVPIEEHKEESGVLNPALRLLPKEQTKPLLDELINEKKPSTTEQKLSTKALIGLEKMIEGRRSLEQIIGAETSN